MISDKGKPVPTLDPAKKTAIQNPAFDWRLLENSTVIPVSSGGYADQPYFLRANDGSLVLICTTCSRTEGEAGQHVACVRSEDNGKSWSAPVALEPASGVEASYAVLLKTPGGRIYAFYNHNTDNVKKVPGDKAAYPDGWCRRVDSLGYFVFKYSDDHGKTWSQKRHPIAVREFEIDRENSVNGAIRYFWNVGKPFINQNKGYISLHKVGGFGVDFFTRSEGALLCSDNILTEADPEKIRFETLPDGDIGLRAPPDGGPIAEEQSFAVLSDGTFFCVYRTVSGSSVCSYSRDHGHTWTAPDYMLYPDGRRIKNSRSATFIWTLSGNRYFYWFNNHSGKSYADRNPIWCLAAHEVDAPEGKKLEFSQPEILLYNDNLTRRMSYPDMLELESGDLLLSETEKEIARMHTVPAGFTRKIFGQWSAPVLPAPEDLTAEWIGTGPAVLTPGPLMIFFDREGGWEMITGKDCRSGCSIELHIRAGAKPGFLADNRKPNGRGFAIELTSAKTIRILLNDGRSESCWSSSMEIGTSPARIVVTLDGGPKTISMILNGKFDDGGELRQFGFGLFHPFFQSLNGAELRVGSEASQFRIYNRALLTAEAVALCHKQFV